MKKSYYIPAKNGFQAVAGYLSECKCGKKFIVQMAINGTIHNSHPAVNCIDCMVVSPQFAQDHPDVAAQIAEWNSAS